MEYITNGFSLQMLAGCEFVADARTYPCTAEEVRKAFDAGAKTLPEGFKLVWLRVEIRNPACVYDC